jgi:AcrR family transcriptional regulator
MKGPDRAPRRAVSASRRRNQLGQSMGAKGLRTREKLLAATEALLNTTPLRELTVAQIVRRASTSTATFYVYFNDVSAVVYALIGELTQSPPSLLVLFARSWDSPVVLDRAHEFVASYFERCLQHAAAFRVRNLSSDEGDLRFTELRINAVLPLLNVMAARLVERQRAGDLPADLHPISAAGALLAMIDRISIVQISALSSVTRPRQLDVAAFFTALLFGGGAPDLKGIPAHTFEAELPPEKPTHKPRGDQTRTSETAARINLHGQLIGAKGARTRLRIIEVTEDLLRTQSLLELSVAKIAKAAETSTSTFYLYFQDVPEAVLAVIAEISQSGPELLTLWGGDWEGVVPSARA